MQMLKKWRLYTCVTFVFCAYHFGVCVFQLMQLQVLVLALSIDLLIISST